MSRSKIRDFSFKKHEEKIAVISISDIDKESPKLFNNSKYIPNMTCYSKVLNALHEKENNSVEEE